MSTKSPYQNFQTSWSEAVNYANQNHIPQSKWYPIYQLDSQRLIQNGYGMSQGARIQAIRSAAGLPALSTPTDNPDPKNLPANVVHNAASLFSGFDPLSMAKNFFDSATNAVEHPYAQLIHPAEDLIHMFTGVPGTRNWNAAAQDFSGVVTGSHSILSLLVPGFFDLGEAVQGKKGLNYLADNPLTSVMDAIPLGRIPMEILGRTEAGAALAEKIGVTPEEFRKLTPGQAAFRRMKVAETPIGPKRFQVSVQGRKGHMMPEPVGSAEKGPQAAMVKMTTGDLHRGLMRAIGAGEDAAKLESTLAHVQSTAGEWFENIMGSFNQAWDKLKIPEKKQVMGYITNDYHTTDLRTDAEIMAGEEGPTAGWTTEQLDALQATIDVSKEFQGLLVNAGILVRQKTYFGQEVYLVTDDERYKPVGDALTKLNAAKDQLSAATGEYTELLDIVDTMDGVIGANVDQFKSLTDTLFDALKTSIPQLADDPRAEKLRAILPSGQKFDRTTPENAKNLGDFLGLQPVTKEYVTSRQSEPFKGAYNTWSPAEQEAYYQADRQLRKTDPDLDPSSSEFRTKRDKDAYNRLKVLGQLHTVTFHAKVNTTTIQMLAELFRPGGLVPEMFRALEDQRWKDFLAITKAVDEKLNRQSFKSPDASQVWQRWRGQMKEIRKYAVMRDKYAGRIEELWTGKDQHTGKLTSRKSKFQTIGYLSERVDRANDEFKLQSILHPPAMWQNYINLELAHQVMETESGRDYTEAQIQRLTNWTDKQKEQLRQDGGKTLMDMGTMQAINSMDNPAVPEADMRETILIQNEIKERIGAVRAAGYEPIFLPTVHVSDAEKDFSNLTVSADRIHRMQATFEKTEKFNPGTIYDFQTGYNKAMAEFIRNHLEYYIQDTAMPGLLMPSDQIFADMDQYYAQAILDRTSGAAPEMDLAQFRKMILDKWGLKEYKPDSIFSVTSPSVVGKTYYIHNNIAKALEKRWHGDDLPGRLYDKTTGVFREAILHWSPRFTLHVVIGGATMLAAVADRDLIMTLHRAWHFARTGEVPQDILDKVTARPNDLYMNPDAAYVRAQIQRTTAAQEGGVAETLISHTMGREASRLSDQEHLARIHGFFDPNDPNLAMKLLTYWPHKNKQLTRFAYNLYHSAAFFQGFAKAERATHYMQEYYDDESRTFKFQKVPMSGDRMFQMGVEHAARVMGDVNSMTPLERNYLTRIFPFWSWTKHVFSYIARFPVDHPYRTMLFTQLSRMGYQDQQNGLPARTQLLFFFGDPTQQSGDNAIDMRYANPLRDSATYLGLQGWISGMNPILTAPMAAIDPEYIYGSNVLYPNLTYDSIYGTQTASPGSKSELFSALEQVIPQSAGLDAALNLSGQFSYLHQNNPAALANKVFTSLGIEAMLPQHVNETQIIAKGEIDRYNQANKAAQAAWQSGDFSALKGYTAVPDPRYGTSPVYTIAPQALASIYSQEAAYIASQGLNQYGATVANYYPNLTNPVL